MTQANNEITNDDPRSNAWANEGASTPVDLFARISSIERAHTLPRDRAQAFLDAVRVSLGAAIGTIAFSAGAEEYELQTEGGPSGAMAWVPALRSAVLESRSHSHTIARVFGSKTHEPEFAVIAAPFDLAGRDAFGAVAVLCRCKDAAHAERLQLHLRSASLLAANMLVRGATRRSGVEMDDFVRVLSKAGQFKNVDEFAYAMTNAAKQRFNCEQTSLGILRGGKLKVSCISGLDQVKHRSPGVHHIEQSMGECLDAGVPIVEQQRDRWEGTEFAAEGMLHKRWRAACAGASVASVPIFSGEDLIAVLSLRRVVEEPFDADEIEAVQKLLAPLGSAIPLISKSTRSLPVHAASSTRSGLGWLVKPQSLRKKLIIGSAIAAAVWYAWMPSMYRVTTPGTVVAQREHVIASTLGSVVEEVLVRSGDRVQVGDPLVRLDTSMLELERGAIITEIRGAELRLKESIAKGDPAGASVVAAEKRVAETRLEGVEARIADAVLTAPTAGVVIGQTLSDLPGRVVREGEPLLSIADENSFTLELSIPQGRVTDMVAGADLKFASHARPESPGRTTLGGVAPTGVLRNGRTVFLSETPIPEGQEWLRPGMEGVAMIDAGMHPNWWIAVHRLLDTARLNFWID